MNLNSLRHGAALAALCGAAAVPAVAHAQTRSAQTTIRANVIRVESASVDNDPSACSLMAPTMQRQYESVAVLAMGHKASTCPAAVSGVYASYVKEHQLSALRSYEAQATAPFKTAPITFSDDGLRATLTARSVDHEAGGAKVKTSLTALMVDSGGVWKVAAISSSSNAKF